jgi:hypothetical protein
MIRYTNARSLDEHRGVLVVRQDGVSMTGSEETRRGGLTSALTVDFSAMNRVSAPSSVPNHDPGQRSQPSAEKSANADGITSGPTDVASLVIDS